MKNIEIKKGDYWWVEFDDGNVELIYIREMYSTKEVYGYWIGESHNLDLSYVKRWIRKIEKPQ